MYCEMCGRWAEDSHLRSQYHIYWLGVWQKPQGIAGTRPDMPCCQAQLAMEPPPPKATPPAPPLWPPLELGWNMLEHTAGPQVAAVLQAGA
eukprot:14370083-Heterocapsa_arctica.AAC.1